MAVILLGACAKRADMDQSTTAGITPTPTGSTTGTPGAGGMGDATGGRSGVTAESRVVRPEGPVASSGMGAGSAQAQSQGGTGTGPLQDIFFDFDADSIRDDQRKSLDANAAWLKSNQRARVTVEGHADERGTNEYNLALAERRAKTTRDYLLAKGVEPNRVTVVTYGEERPFVMGHDESAWQWNRRAHFVITGQ
jgi:peptidoglycan-associated lipoprotein